MKHSTFAKAAALSALLAVTGCGSFQVPLVSGVIDGGSRFASDPSLAERYPTSASAAQAESHRSSGIWQTTWRGRKAEKMSIARDMPHAEVAPGGTAKGF